MLTVKEIEKLKPRAKPYEVLDGAGLYLTVRPSGAKAFNLRYRHGGAPRNLTIGPLELGLAEARRLATEARGAIARGDDPCALKNARKAAAAAAVKALKEPTRDSVVARRRAVSRQARPSEDASRLATGDRAPVARRDSAQIGRQGVLAK